METRAARRKRKLADLCARFSTEGGLAYIAEQAGVSAESLEQILKGVMLPPKRDGSRSPRNLGDATAHAIEDALHLGRGWFDSDVGTPQANESPAFYRPLSVQALADELVRLVADHDPATREAAAALLAAIARHPDQAALLAPRLEGLLQQPQAERSIDEMDSQPGPFDPRPWDGVLSIASRSLPRPAQLYFHACLLSVFGDRQPLQIAQLVAPTAHQRLAVVNVPVRASAARRSGARTWIHPLELGA